MNRDCGRLILQSVSWLYLRLPLERVHCRPHRQIVQRSKSICCVLGGCLISWCIIPGCLLCQFATGTTLNSQLQGPFRGHRIAKGTLKGFQITATIVIFTAPTTTHHSPFSLKCLTKQEKARLQQQMWHLNSFSSHSATSVEYLPKSTQHTIISNTKTPMHYSSPKQKSNLSIPMTAAFSLLI